MRRGGSVSGAASLVMIFCVLCLVVFATLTYVTANRERQLAELTAQSAAEYYAADAEATRIVAALARGERPDADYDFTDVYPDSPFVAFRIPAGGEQELYVRVRLYPDGSYDILRWDTVFAGEWETNDTIDISDGDL